MGSTALRVTVLALVVFIPLRWPARLGSVPWLPRLSLGLLVSMVTARSVTTGLLTLVVLALPLPLLHLRRLGRRAVSLVLTRRFGCRRRLSALTLGHGLEPRSLVFQWLCAGLCMAGASATSRDARRGTPRRLGVVRRRTALSTVMMRSSRGWRRTTSITASPLRGTVIRRTRLTGRGSCFSRQARPMARRRALGAVVGRAAQGRAAASARLSCCVTCARLMPVTLMMVACSGRVVCGVLRALSRTQLLRSHRTCGVGRMGCRGARRLSGRRWLRL